MGRAGVFEQMAYHISLERPSVCWPDGDAPNNTMMAAIAVIQEGTDQSFRSHAILTALRFCRQARKLLMKSCP